MVTTSLNEEHMRAVHKQAMDNWINPEILARHSRGEVELPIVLRSAQVVFGIDGSHKVRINEEVKGKFVAKLKRAVKKGEFLTYQDVEDLHFSEQHPDDEGYGHITLVSNGDDKWSVSFSFIYGTDKVEQYLKLGKEFLEQANKCVKESPRTAVSLGMTATENIIKARLAASPRVKLKTKNHWQLWNLYNYFVNEDPAKTIHKKYKEAFKYFSSLFNRVRYNPEHLKIHRSTLKKNLRIVDSLYRETQGLVKEVEVTSFKQRQVKLR